ncbi:MAG: NAD-dependent epimerase/dehydratase family protein [Fimbriimonadaceae bacterium]|nr:NAD-dependent epimerase/dehydratase family protein [Fimbriimonadaceae bacterium]
MSELVLVTGGAGFIGSHVCETLTAAGKRVRVLDNLASGKRENLAHLPQVELVAGSITSDADLAAALEGVAAVVHLAAEPSVAKSMTEPVATHAVNYTGTLQLLEAMRVAGATRIIYASSAATYTPNSAEPHRETDYPDPSSPYGIDKLAGEFALRAYARAHGVVPTALRFFNIYGERQDPSSAYSGVISIFVDRIKAGRGITIFGDGSQRRDFVYVRDLAAIIASLVDRTDAPDLMNVGTGHSVTLRELVATLETIFGVRAQVTYAEPRLGDIHVSRADNSRLRTIWPGAFTPLETGLVRLVASLEA